MSATKDKMVCDYNEFRRLRYFHGMLLDDKDFLAEQAYHAAKRRLLNRMLHGSGVVCGLDLNGKIGAKWLEVTPGLALDCCGNEIWVNKPRQFDIADLLPPKKRPKEADKECVDPNEGGQSPKKYYLGIRYDEKETDPVSVYLPGAGCEERACEGSRVKEGYCLEIISDCCTGKYDKGILREFCDCENDFASKDKFEPLCRTCGELKDADKCRCLVLEDFGERSVPCGECGHCESPCHVILGQISVDEKGTIQSICINECREYVLTGRMVKHLIGSTLGGLGKDGYFKVKIENKEINFPDAGELARNPIKALTGVLRYFNPVSALAQILRYFKIELIATKCQGLIPPAGKGANELEEEIKRQFRDRDNKLTRTEKKLTDLTEKKITDLQSRTEGKLEELDKVIQDLRKTQPPVA